MYRKVYIASCLWLVLLTWSCKESKNSPVENPPAANLPSSSQQVDNSSTASIPETGLTGEWVQEFCVIDQNSNYQLDEPERNGGKIEGGFDYFKFNADGTCLRDRDIQFRGTYDLAEKNGKPKLNIHTDPRQETYSYTVIANTANELILFESSVFLVYKRIL